MTKKKNTSAEMLDFMKKLVEIFLLIAKTISTTQRLG